jgi:hypothetical protein
LQRCLCIPIDCPFAQIQFSCGQRVLAEAQ